jgi:hypothetical protein
MMQPMPPQGADDQAPAEGGAAKLMSALQDFGSEVEQAGPEATQEYASLVEAFQAFTEKLSGGEGKESPGGSSSMEAGGNPNARPM